MDGYVRVPFRAALILVLMLLFDGCVSFQQSLYDSGIYVLKGQTVYNRVGLRMWAGNKIWFTNIYHSGTFIPAGSECTIMDVSRSKIVFTWEGEMYQLGDWIVAKGGAPAKIIRQSFYKYFTENKKEIGLGKVDPDFRDGVISGVEEIGMTKEEILMSLGYPAYLGLRDLTIDDSREAILSYDNWRYMRSYKRDTILLIFKAGRLFKISE